jgi:alpha-tubulin suppressor-like RCC1 family protein
LHEPQKVDFEMYCEPHLRQINAGGSHTGFIDDVGRLFICGKNDSGQLGQDSFLCESLPVIVDRIKGVIKEVACGDEHTLILDK